MMESILSCHHLYMSEFWGLNLASTSTLRAISLALLFLLSFSFLYFFKLKAILLESKGKIPEQIAVWKREMVKMKRENHAI